MLLVLVLLAAGNLLALVGLALLLLVHLRRAAARTDARYQHVEAALAYMADIIEAQKKAVTVDIRRAPTARQATTLLRPVPPREAMRRHEVP